MIGRERFYSSYSNYDVDNGVCYDRGRSDEFVGRSIWRIGGDDSPVDDESAAELASSTSLQSMLSAIIEERNRDHHLAYCHEIPDGYYITVWCLIIFSESECSNNVVIAIMVHFLGNIDSLGESERRLVMRRKLVLQVLNWCDKPSGP